MPAELAPLQLRVLEVLRSEPGWTLSGGAALTGFHLHHRPTRDLDLFFHGVRTFEEQPARIEGALSAAGLDVTPLQRSPGFVRLKVGDASGDVVVDLVAEPVPVIEPPVEVRPGLHVDTPHEILVNKLCALLSRSELRDLEDVRVLLAAGGDLDRALRDAPRKDAGFSPMTLAWLLEQLPLERAEALGFSSAELDAARRELVVRLGRVEP